MGGELGCRFGELPDGFASCRVNSVQSAATAGDVDNAVTIGRGDFQRRISGEGPLLGASGHIERIERSGGAADIGRIANDDR